MVVRHYERKLGEVCNLRDKLTFLSNALKAENYCFDGSRTMFYAEHKKEIYFHDTSLNEGYDVFVVCVSCGKGVSVKNKSVTCDCSKTD